MDQDSKIVVRKASTSDDIKKIAELLYKTDKYIYIHIGLVI